MKEDGMNKYKKAKDEKQGRLVLRFVMPSLLGILLFMCPIRSNGNITIPVAVLSEFLQDRVGHLLPLLILVLGVISVIGCLVTILSGKISKCKPIKSSLLLSLFPSKISTLFLRIAALVGGVSVYFQIGHEAVYSELTGGLVFYDLLPILCTIFLLAGFLLPLLLNYGLLEFAGTLLIKVMRPLFRLPGRAAIDAIASWLGDGTIGVMLTSKQYEDGFYTEKEACIIGTSFSLVSITFCLVVINNVGLSHMFLPFYLTVSIACLIAAVILPKFPPLSRKRDCFINESRNSRTLASEKAPSMGLKAAYQNAIKTVEGKRVIPGVVAEGTCNVLSMWIGVIPIVMVTGTAALIVAEYTPIFKILGVVFLPLLRLLGVPEAAQASQTMLAGFADMLLPSVMIANVENDMTRFIVAAVSVSQLVYMSEIGALLLASSIPIKLRELFVIFLERTLITLPVITLIARLIFKN